MTTADRLLDAHVAYQLGRLRGGQFVALVESEVDWALTRAHDLTLDQVVGREQVKAVAAKYVSSFDLPGAIPDVVGEIATRLRTHPANETTLGEVLPREHIAAAVEKISELRPVRRWVAQRIAQSPTVQARLAEYVRSFATAPIAANRRLAGKLPGVSSALSMGERLAGGVMREADQRSRELAEKTAAAILTRWSDSAADSITDEDLAEALLGVWDSLSDRQIRDLLDAVADEDLVDAVVIGYDLWLDLRLTDYLQSLIDTGVDYFYDTYGSFPLDELLAEFGLGRDDLIEEAVRFAPPAIETLDAAGLLEQFVRRQLEGFYASPEVQNILR